MASAVEQFDVNGFQKLLLTSKMGRKIIYKDVTGSTMDDARKLGHDAAEYPHGTVVMSERQTKARGARDHKWDASNTGNIYVSFILHLPPHYKTFEGRFSLEVAACLSVLEVSRKFGVTNAIPKWPNDVWVRGHKLAGFLAEDGRFDVLGSLSSLLILGIGINVNADIRRNSALQSIATSLYCERGGVFVNREQFLADVCAALEKYLANKHEENMEMFTRENLFQENCDISVTCPTVGKVMDGKFLEICGNWEVKFLDKSKDRVLQGRSDFYTIRPKVTNKILVVFSGGQDNKSASNLASWLMSVLDTSLYVVCLVPETSITGTDEWMKTCSLLVLSENVCSSDTVSRKVNTFLRLKGRVMSAGMGSLFLAKVLDIPLREVLLESSSTNPNVGFVHLLKKSNLSSNTSEQTSAVTEENSSTSAQNGDNSSEAAVTSTEPSDVPDSTVFPTNPVCFQFFEDEKALLSESGSSSSQSSEGKETDSNELQVESPSTSSNANSSSAQVKAHYVNMGDKRSTLAVFTAGVVSGGCVALWGFDIGVVYPAGSGGEGVKIEAEEEKEVEKDRFRRDLLLQEVVEVLLKQSSKAE